MQYQHDLRFMSHELNHNKVAGNGKHHVTPGLHVELGKLRRDMVVVRVKQQNPFLFEKIPDNEVLLCLMHYYYNYLGCEM